jgi:thiol-disulfide isomerase/thioredoxin
MIVLAAASGDDRSAPPRLSVLFFTAPWCGPCRPIYPIVSEFQKKHETAVKVFYVDFDTNRADTERWSVTEIPVVIAIGADGTLLLRVDGASRETLRLLPESLEKALARSHPAPRLKEKRRSL